MPRPTIHRHLAVSVVLALLASAVPAVVHAEDPTFQIEYPLPARTGQPFTIEPVYSDGYVPPPDTICRWEFRWGNTASLRDNEFDETFGYVLFEGRADDGYCGAWTFTLPWVPVPQYEIFFRGPVPNVRSGSWPDRDVFTATVYGTERRITSSNLPLVQVLPSTYTPVTGQSVTYTRYLVGGAPSSGMATWTAHLGSGENPTVWERHTTASTFTITPPHTGRLLVQWYRETNGLLTSAGYDPPVRVADRTDPNTSAPRARFASSRAGSSTSVLITWSGTDSGWGVASYRLEKSIRGGTWRRVTLPAARSTEYLDRLLFDSAYRYRVRATDKAGNVGAWDYSPTIVPRRVPDTNPSISYSGGWRIVDDETAFGARLHETSTAGRTVQFTFTGRAIAWIGERGEDFGTARVYVDGKFIKTVDSGSDQSLPKWLVFRMSWSSSERHTIRIVADGTAGRPAIRVDGFAFIP
jgi:hypothetical protein